MVAVATTTITFESAPPFLKSPRTEIKSNISLTSHFSMKARRKPSDF